MKAIISNGRRSQVYNQDLDFNGLNQFVSDQFPRMRKVIFYFKDENNKNIPISSNEEIELVKRMNQGQKFVEIFIEGERSSHSKHGRGKWSPRRNINEADPTTRRINALAKVFGGEPKNFESFVTENKHMHLGELIKKYSKDNNLPVNKDTCERRRSCERRSCEGRERFSCSGRKMKFFERIFGENKTA